MLSRAASVLGGVVAIAFVIRAPVLALLTAGVGWAFLRSPARGLLALVLGSIGVAATVQIGTVTDVNFPSVVVPLLGLLWLRALPDWRALGRLWSAPFRALGAFMAIAVASALLANVPSLRFALAVAPQAWFPLAQPASLGAQGGQLALFAICLGTFVLVADQVRALRPLEEYTFGFLLLAAVFVACGVVPELRPFRERLAVKGVTDGSLFWVWLVALASTQATFNRSLPAGVRLALGVLVGAALHIATSENRDWLSGWLPSLVTLAAGLALGAPRLTLVAVGLGGIALVATGEAARLVAVGEEFAASLATADNQYSLQTRLEAWRILGTLVLANPFLGLGPANYHHYGVHFPILGHNVQFSSHNNYVDIVAQTGLAGFACLAGFAWWTRRLGWRLRAVAPAGFARAYVIGTLAGLAGTLTAGMLGDWFLPFVYNTGRVGLRASLLAWFFLGGLVVVRHAARDGDEPARRPQPSRRSRSRAPTTRQS